MQSKYVISCDFMDIPRRAQACWTLKDTECNGLLLLACTIATKRPEGVYVCVDYIRYATFASEECVPYFMQYLLENLQGFADFIEIPRRIFLLNPKLRLMGFVPTPDNPETAIYYMANRDKRPRLFFKELRK